MKEQASSLLHAFMRQQVQKDDFSLILIWIMAVVPHFHRVVHVGALVVFGMMVVLAFLLA